MIAGGVCPQKVGVCGVGGVGTLIVSLSVFTVPPKAKALPAHDTVSPTVIPAASITLPIKVVFAASVVAPVGVHQTLQAEAPPDNVTAVLTTVSSAASIRKIYVPLPLRLMFPTLAAPMMQ